MDIFIHLNTHPLMFVPPHHSQVLQGRPIYIALCIHGCRFHQSNNPNDHNHLHFT